MACGTQSGEGARSIVKIPVEALLVSRPGPGKTLGRNRLRCAELIAEIVLDFSLQLARMVGCEEEAEIRVCADGDVPPDPENQLAIKGDFGFCHEVSGLYDPADLIHLHAGDVGVADQQLDRVGLTDDGLIGFKLELHFSHARLSCLGIGTNRC